MADPPDFSTWSVNADTKPVRVLLSALGSSAPAPSSSFSTVPKICARNCLNSSDEVTAWTTRTMMDARTK